MTPKQYAKQQAGLLHRERLSAWRMVEYERERDVFSYLRIDSRHWRPTPDAPHKKWDGLILPYDDPVWQWFFPPNCRDCRCQVRQVSETELKRKGWTVSTIKPTRDDVAPGYAVNWREKYPEVEQLGLPYLDEMYWADIKAFEQAALES